MHFEIIVILFSTMLISFILTPFVRKLALWIGAVDRPSNRRVNKMVMPSMGGLTIFIAFNLAVVFALHDKMPANFLWGVFLGESVIVVTGVLDDVLEIKPHYKMLGIITAGLIVYFVSDIRMKTLTIPFFRTFNLHWISLLLTLLWISTITNAINLIDGLDGLATGVSMISLTAMGITGLFFLPGHTIYMVIMIFMFVAAEFGFLPYNFFPARIYLGDTGALLIGFMMSVFSLMGLKNVTFMTTIIPIIVLGVPLTDTIYAIIRRRSRHESVAQADKYHLHHRLMSMGLTHRQTVLEIYGISLLFAFVSLIYPISTVWGSILLTLGILIGVEVLVESVGLSGTNRRPLLNFARKLIQSSTSSTKVEQYDKQAHPKFVKKLKNSKQNKDHK